MESSSIFSIIQSIKDNADPDRFIKQDDKYLLYNYVIGHNISFVRVYISAEIHPDSLDKGKRITKINFG